MKEKILESIDSPSGLEGLYRSDKVSFTREFNLLYPVISDHISAVFWNERLNYNEAESSTGKQLKLPWVIIAAVISCVLAKLPEILNIDQQFYYTRNISFIVFPILSFFFIYLTDAGMKKAIIIKSIFLFCLLYINFLPNDNSSQTIILSYIHMPFLLWSVFGFAFIGKYFKDPGKRMEFLRFNGDLVVMSAVIIFSGALCTVMMMQLFRLIMAGDKFFLEYVAICGSAASPVAALYVINRNAKIVSRISPVIAKIFSPLILTSLIIYLTAIIAVGVDPYQDRNFLLRFNILLIGVLAIILFSAAETLRQSESRMQSIILLSLSVVTMIVNGIALSAIIFRISEWGISPNKLAVLVSNILIFSNLIIVAFYLFKNIRGKGSIDEVLNIISVYLPVYCIWTFIVIFLFPVMFGFK